MSRWKRFWADNSSIRAGERTLRDQFALEAMKVILASEWGAEADKPRVAEEAYNYADAMLEARKK